MRLPLKHLRSTEGHRQRSINDSLPSRPHPLSPPPSPFTPFSSSVTPSTFFPKDNPRWPFCLLSEIACSEIDRRLRPTDVCSAATALTLRYRKNIIGFLYPHLLLLAFFLTHRLPLIRFLRSAWERARARRAPPIHTVASWEESAPRTYKYIYFFFNIRALCNIVLCEKKFIAEKSALLSGIKCVSFFSRVWFTWENFGLISYSPVWCILYCSKI